MENFVNGVSTRLNGAITSGALTAAIISATGFPSSGETRCLICQNSNGVISNGEIVLVTARTGTILTIARAVEGWGGAQTALAHADGEYVTIVLTEASLLSLQTSGDLSYVHDQAVASNSWTVAHGLNKRPAVQVVDSAGSQVEGDVFWLDDNHVRLDFSAPFSGRAYFN